jgi:hypothetical protein
MIPADILMIPSAALGVMLVWLVWLVLRWAGRAIARKRARLIEPDTHSVRAIARRLARQVEPDNCGDQGSMPEPVKRIRPKAPESGSGLLVEDVLDMPRFLRRKAGD